MKLNRLTAWVVGVAAMIACTPNPKGTPEEPTTLSGLKRSQFQSVVNGDSTDLYVLKNANGVSYR